MQPLPLRYKLENRLSRVVPFRPFSRRGRTPVVTFTFDDFPRSALHAGGPILEAAGAVGTYYVCGGLTGSRDASGAELHTKDDLKDLVAAGHDLACHTFSHRACWDVSAQSLRDELARNKAFLDDLLGDVYLASFAYPFGIGGFTAKRVMAEHFPAARSTDPGMEIGWMDLAQLNAERLYTSTQTENSVRALIRDAVEKRAWLIFYTHDVTEDPSPYGCTPALMQAAVSAAEEAGCRILSMRNALAAAIHG